MSAIYQKAPKEVAERAKALIEKHHFDLNNNDVHVDYIFANATVNDDGVPSGPAISHGGYPALGVARILGSKDRVMGRGDCEIVIDGDRWPNLSDAQQDALLDHELEHFQLKFDKYGGTVMDDSHRPKMKVKKHDHQFGWFDSIALRHGADSIEVNQFRELCEDESGQYFLPFLNLDNAKVGPDIKDLAKKFRDRMAKSLGPDGSVTITVPGSNREPVVIKGK